MSNSLQAIAGVIARRLDEVSNSEDLSIFDAWPRVSAEMLGYQPDSVEFFSNRDGGIDFCARADRTFEVFQCKMHELDPAGDIKIGAAFDLPRDLRTNSYLRMAPGLVES